MKNLFLTLSLLLPCFTFAQLDNYQHRVINDFNVYIELDAINNHEVKTNDAINLLTWKLDEINELGLQKEILDSLHNVKIFMDWSTTTGAAVYHPGLQWLLNNGYIREKWKSVEISNITNFADWSRQNQPFMVMHELAHAYHDRILGFNYQPITEAYNAAMASSSYSSVSYHAGNGNYFNREAYATTNHIEYFAELTEAYLGTNDFFPFVRDEIQEHDSLGYEVVKNAWLFEQTTNLDVDIEKLDILYPNPVKDRLNIEFHSLNPNKVIKIISLDGKVLRKFQPSFSKSMSLDLSNLATGVYVVSTGNRNYKIVKL